MNLLLKAEDAYLELPLVNGQLCVIAQPSKIRFKVKWCFFWTLFLNILGPQRPGPPGPPGEVYSKLFSDLHFKHEKLEPLTFSLPNFSLEN